MSKYIDHDNTDEIVCPYCGYKHSDSWDYQNDDIGLIECGSCNKEFYAYREITVTYSTEKPTFGTCSCCGAKNVIVEDYHSTLMRKDNIGVRCCMQKEKYKALAEQIKRFTQEKELGEEVK